MPQPPDEITKRRSAERERGRNADRPSDISFKGWKDVLWRVWSKMGADRVLLIAAVALAAAGLLSLAAVLVSAWLGVQPWQGFMAAAYLCLPLGFLLMIASVVIGVISRGRS